MEESEKKHDNGAVTQGMETTDQTIAHKLEAVERLSRKVGEDFLKRKQLQKKKRERDSSDKKD